MQLAYPLKFPKSSAMFGTKYFSTKFVNFIPNCTFSNDNHKVYAARSVNNRRKE